MKRMLFNATQAEELRVAIVDGQKLIDLDIESAAKEQRKSNIYKAVITRIEPSLEAAFVDYGAERHGFLPFKEVSSNYFKPGVDAGKARIQDALTTGQELIVQVEKDERGNKGAALTTYVSLAGRYLVLMPNNPRGGGVSRRVEGEDRQELREIMDQLNPPSGMSLIARTAGIGRGFEELKWDLNYLLQLWAAIDGAAKAQNGAFLIYQESSLVIRAIRDYFHSEIGEILIDTDDVFEQAQQFMAHVMPGNVSKVKRYHDDVPLFSRFQIEHQIESAYSRQVTLPSGGAIVIDHTEALVSVDVNSGRATKGSDIEETAFRTNCEAADEIARQLRLRDLGGLIVIDFIDMESAKNQREVENRLRDALHFDRARVQTGKISRFGLLELSRQRLRPALAETSYITCPRCTGTGHIRSTESAALHILRILEEEAMKENTGALHCQVPVDVGTFLLNEKRVDIAHIEVRHHVNLVIVPNRHLETPAHEIVRLRHDQLNVEGVQIASYQMAEKPAEETYQPPSAQNEAKPARAVAAVKGITPDQPAPIVEPKSAAPAPVPAASGGLFAMIASWFRSKKEETPAVSAETSNEQSGRGERGNRNGRGRDGRRDGRGRDGRDNKEGRETREAGSRQPAPPKRDDVPPTESGSRRGRGEQKEGREPKEVREPRPPREPREPRPPRNDKPEAQSAVSPAPTFGVDAVADGDAGNRGRSRRGRGRGRGERRDEAQPSGATEALNNADVPVSTAQSDGVMSATPDFTPGAAAATTAVVIAEAHPLIVTAAPVVVEPVAPVVPVSPSPQELQQPILEVTPPASEVASVAVPVVEVAPAVVAAVAIPDVATVATVPTVAAEPPLPVAEATPVDLTATLESVGLVMVQTSSSGVAASPVVATLQPLGRKPKPAAVVANEPLQMVETRNN
jgi:ribonuclease E